MSSVCLVGVAPRDASRGHVGAAALVASPRDGVGLGGLGGDEEEEEDTLRQGDVGDSRMMFGPDQASDIVPSN